MSKGTMDEETVDRFLDGRWALALSALWGLAEATCFFIVPDVGLMAVGIRGYRKGLKAVVAALLGALIGGALVFGLAADDASRMRRFLARIPAISPPMIADVGQQIRERGAAAILIGPLRGTPYKIYAAEWGAAGHDLLSLLLISVPARSGRFILSVIVARLLGRALSRWTGQRIGREWVLLAMIWIAFYLFYFARFGW